MLNNRSSDGCLFLAHNFRGNIKMTFISLKYAITFKVYNFNKLKKSLSTSSLLTVFTTNVCQIYQECFLHQLR